MADKKKSEAVLLSEQHEAALEEYAKGVRLLQQQDFSMAIPRFETILEKFPQEGILCDRARLYLAIARRAAEDRAPLTSSREPEHAFEVGVFLLNDGQFKEAVLHLERAVEHAPQDDGAQVALAAARARSGDVDGSLNDLRRAVELDPASRYRVRAMSDFDGLEDDPRFREIILEG